MYTWGEMLSYLAFTFLPISETVAEAADDLIWYVLVQILREMGGTIFFLNIFFTILMASEEALEENNTDWLSYWVIGTVVIVGKLSRSSKYQENLSTNLLGTTTG